MSNLDFHFKHPTTIHVSGSILCGKTRLVLRILEEQLVQPFPTRIIRVFSEWQPDYEQPEAFTLTLNLCEGGPMKMAEAGVSNTLSNLFTKGAS